MSEHPVSWFLLFVMLMLIHIELGKILTILESLP